MKFPSLWPNSVLLMEW